MKNTGSFRLTSMSFKHNETMPSIHTQIGFDSGSLNISPDLVWGNVPDRTKSFALICEDPDAINGIFVHWVVYDIPEKTHELPSRITSEKVPLGIGVEGQNSAGTAGYVGPRPPAGTGMHRYIFTLYALNNVLGLKAGLTAEELKKAIQGHVIAKAELTGLCAASAT